MKRYPAWLSAVLVLSACSSGSSQTATLILDNPTWDRVNVEAVITNSADCDNRGKDYVATKQFVMTKGHTQKIEAPNAESICWRHDRNPNNPTPGAWSGWSRDHLAPGPDGGNRSLGFGGRRVRIDPLITRECVDVAASRIAGRARRPVTGGFSMPG